MRASEIIKRAGGAWPKARQRARQAASFVRTVISVPVDDAEFSRRLAVCEAQTDGCMLRQGEQCFCTKCGCGKNRLAELHTKLRFSRSRCPLKKW